ncbi:hypothetical protein [Hugenholtzia roseola]|uniref:hypothetical protein n=1 Tax=Hugenholtzia roseola TaxID=1002 RepID=UPI000408D267|nr:hypothetical protein [Hugenholtzia roseola]
MNVIFHTTTAVGVAILLTDTKRIEQARTLKDTIWTSILAFIVGVISHGALDYIPHCYPINSKLDVFAGLAMILITVWLTNKKYQFIMGLSFLGSIFPDLVDLSPSIINKQLGFNLPILDKIFPWHLHDYSGSNYTNDCSNSFLNHLLLLLTISIILWCRQTDLRAIFNKKYDKNN